MDRVWVDLFFFQKPRVAASFNLQDGMSQTSTLAELEVLACTIALRTWGHYLLCSTAAVC